MEDLESGNLSYAIVGEYLVDLKEGFGGRDNKTMKVAELKKVEQEFKRGINGVIRQKLMESEYPFWYIKQWYKQVVNLNRYWRESKREEKRLKKGQKIEAQAPN